MTVSSISCGRVVFFEQNIALAVFALGHERLEPFHRGVALRRAARLLHENEHLTEAIRIDGDHQQIQQKGRDGSAERAEAGEESAADHVRDPQRHHGLRHQGGDKEDRAHQGKHVGQGDIVQKDFQQPVEDGVVGDVVGVETQLNQDLGERQVVGCRVEDAIQRTHSSAPPGFISSPRHLRETAGFAAIASRQRPGCREIEEIIGNMASRSAACLVCQALQRLEGLKSRLRRRI